MFTKEGDKWFHHWLINGQRDFALIPAGVMRGFDVDLPVRLQNGNPYSFGYTHIEKRMKWVKSISEGIPELIYAKLGQSGQVWSTELESKIKIVMQLAPEAMLVLTEQDRTRQGGDRYLSVTTIYNPRGSAHLDGELIGRYQSEFRI